MGGFPIAVSTPHNWDSLWQPFFGFGSFVFTQIIDCCGSPFKLHIFYFFFPPLALTRAERTDVGIGMLAISISRDNSTARAHYLIDSNSLPTYYIVTFLLRRTRHFSPSRFIMFKRTIYCSRVDPRSHLLGRLSRR